MSGGTPAIANAMPRPPSGGTPKQGAEKPALGNGRPPFLHLGPDSVHDGLVHGLRVSALHSQANPFIRFLSLGTIKSATSGLLASSSSTCGRFAMVQRMVSTRAAKSSGTVLIRSVLLPDARSFLYLLRRCRKSGR